MPITVKLIELPSTELYSFTDTGLAMSLAHHHALNVQSHALKLENPAKNYRVDRTGSVTCPTCLRERTGCDNDRVPRCPKCYPVPGEGRDGMGGVLGLDW
ncbi:MAG TPA: hypothetical protein DCG47_13575 [Spirochaetaceae bacterium]|jgi:hypothetical protein|nr:hypothetical protein [Spirochaetaceae bacterium]